ncbi:MAG: shikimate kinase [Pedobacter sp.]|nr:MAG: shikimate kinase [Pedobacter sp.]
MKVFLIGFMGCGKSTKAKQLSNYLNYPLFDIDNLIEKEAQMPISDYFKLHGESAFRILEKHVLQNHPFPEHAIIATGGGLPCFFNNMKWMNAQGITVYLEMHPKQLVSRLGNRHKRPLIKDMDDVQLLSFIETKLKERETFYKQATLSLNAFDLDLAQLASTLNLTSLPK